MEPEAKKVRVAQSEPDGQASQKHDSVSNGAAHEEIAASIQQLLPKVDAVVSALDNTKVIVEVFDPECQENLFERISTIHKEFGELYKISSSLNKVQVPHKIIEQISEGKNPFLHHAGQMDESIKLNREAYGKLKAIQEYRKCLESEIRREYAVEYGTYLAQRNKPLQDEKK